MKPAALFLLMFFIQINCFAQKLRDRFEYKVTYELTYRLDSTELEPKAEYMILFLGDEVSVYSSRSKTQSHSPTINGFSGSTSKNALTAFHDVIIKDSEEEKIYNTKQIPGTPADHFYYTQDLHLMQWEMGTETKQIEGYQTQKATTNYAGRNYVAWFTPEVPIADGPFKFNGLPGLILEISDSEEDYVFAFVGLEKLSPTVPFKLNLKKLIATEKKELEDLWYRYRRDPFTYDNKPNVKMDPEVHKKYVESFTKMLEKENNPIEIKE